MKISVSTAIGLALLEKRGQKLGELRENVHRYLGDERQWVARHLDRLRVGELVRSTGGRCSRKYHLTAAGRLRAKVAQKQIERMAAG